MESHRFKLGVRLVRRATKSSPMYHCTVVFCSDAFKIIRTDCGREMSIGNTPNEQSLYTEIPTLENK